MTQKKLKMIVEPEYHKNIDSLGDWDGTWDETFEYIIFSDQEYYIKKQGGYHTAEKAKEAGEKALKRLKLEKQYI